MIEVKIDTSDWEYFYSTFNNQHFPMAIKETEQVLVADIQDHFKQKNFYGGKWEDHTPHYKIWMRRKYGKINALLNQSGSLMNSMKKPNVTKLRGDGARFVFKGKGKSAKYAHVHNNFYPYGFWVKYPYGNKNIGVRRIAPRGFGWASQKATNDIRKIWTNIV